MEPVSTYYRALCTLADQEGISLKQALSLAVPNLGTDGLILRFARGEEGDAMTTAALARFFHTDEATLTGNCPVRPGPGLVYLIRPRSDQQEDAKRAKAWLEGKGRSVVDPEAVHDVLPLAQMPENCLFNLDAYLLSLCSEAAFLPGWQSDPACRALHEYAPACGIAVIGLSEGSLRDGQRLLDGLEVPNFPG